jgi:hypothetical protein
MKMKRLSHGVGANVTGEEVGSSVLITSNGAGLGFSVALHTSKNLQTGSMMGTGYGGQEELLE